MALTACRQRPCISCLLLAICFCAACQCQVWHIWKMTKAIFLGVQLFFKGRRDIYLSLGWWLLACLGQCFLNFLYECQEWRFHAWGPTTTYKRWGGSLRPRTSESLRVHHFDDGFDRTMVLSVWCNLLVPLPKVSRKILEKMSLRRWQILMTT